MRFGALAREVPPIRIWGGARYCGAVAVTLTAAPIGGRSTLVAGVLAAVTARWTGACSLALTSARARDLRRIHDVPDRIFTCERRSRSPKPLDG